jgi:hypothetical protein
VAGTKAYGRSTRCAHVQHAVQAVCCMESHPLPSDRCTHLRLVKATLTFLHVSPVLTSILLHRTLAVLALICSYLTTASSKPSLSSSTKLSSSACHNLAFMP